MMPIYVFGEGPHKEEAVFPMTTERLLRYLGASRKLIGFRYVEFMVERVLEKPDELQMITKCLYPETARYFGVSVCSVERAVRVLILSCWSQKEHTPMEFIAGRNLPQPPTNLEFIDIMSSYLRGESRKRA